MHLTKTVVVCALTLWAALAQGQAIDGSDNNRQHPEWGTPNQQFLRRAPAAYVDGFTPTGGNRPSARVISNTIVAGPEEPVLDERNLAAWIYAWGQFIDHDFDLAGTAAPTEPFPVSVPKGDPFFDPQQTGTQVIPLSRSLFAPGTGTSRHNPRQQLNTITAYLDASQIYGSDQQTSDSLRAHVGGRLLTSGDRLLPVDAQGNFRAGDVRVNENVELTCVHTLFMREHNRWCRVLARQHPSWDDATLFDAARSRVRALVQIVTYREYIPALIMDIRSFDSGYRPNVNVQISTEFSTAGFRLGHSQLGRDVEFMDNDAAEVRAALQLREAFNNPQPIKDVGPDPVLKYLATDKASRIDNQIVDDVRNFLFGAPGQGGFDLASLNIQRGRDHGIPGYNAVRQAYSLRPAGNFNQVTSNRQAARKLQELYGAPDNMDLWVGVLAEDHLPQSALGPLGVLILSDQFSRTRAGDRFWYTRVFQGRELRELQDTRLSDIIKRNTTIQNLQENVFFFDPRIAGTVFKDTDRNGRCGYYEKGVAGVTVQLIGEETAETKTDRHGHYEFALDEPGTFIVRVRGAKDRKVQITKGGTVQVDAPVR